MHNHSIQVNSFRNYDPTTDRRTDASVFHICTRIVLEKTHLRNKQTVSHVLLT